MADIHVTSNEAELSLVIPCFNEKANLRPLVAALHAAMEPLKMAYEIIVVDDCSDDSSWAVLKQLAAGDRRLRGLKLERNSGQSAAQWAGIRAAQGRIVGTLDADLQHQPRDLPKFLEALKQVDCVCGTRVNVRGQGANFIRVASSWIWNLVRNKLSGENISDSGCCYRVFKRECVAGLKFFNGIHRFLPTLIKLEGFTLIEIPINTCKRMTGESKYGVWNRLFVAFYDLLAVCWMKKRMLRYEIAERVN